MSSSRLATVVIVIASTVVYVRVILEVALVAPQHLAALVPPVAIMMGASALTAGFMWLRVRRTSEEMPQQPNPTELRSALLFAGLYAGVLMALSAARTYLGGQGLYAVAVLSGLTDMDAITLSTSRFVELGPERGGIESALGWKLIVLATIANHFFKWTMCIVVGKGRLAAQVGVLFSVPMIVGVLVLWLWPVNHS